MADAFSAGFREFCGGVQHAVSGHRILLFFLNSRLICVSSAKVRAPRIARRRCRHLSSLNLTLSLSLSLLLSPPQCFVLNGLIFLGSIFFFDRAVIPVIHLFGEILQQTFSFGCVHVVHAVHAVAWTALTSTRRVTQTEPGGRRARPRGRVRLPAVPGPSPPLLLEGKPGPRSLTSAVQVLWMYPIYCISFILNTIWYQEIADDGEYRADGHVREEDTHSGGLEAYMQLHGKPAPTPVADMIRYARELLQVEGVNDGADVRCCC